MSEENVKVAVRVRPFNSREITRKAQLIINMSGQQTTIKDPDNMNAAPKTFTFDYSYWSHDGYTEDKDGHLSPKDKKYADQKKIFDDLGCDVLDNAWKGYNCSLFAYGQTGSGKSYSIVGFGSNKGIVPLTCEELFKSINEKRVTADKDNEFQVSLSMLEIYNEQVRDLLVMKTKEKGGLKVRQHPTKGFYVETLTIVKVGSYAQIENKVNEGTRNRTVASTDMNATSSERADSSGAVGDRLKEAAIINQSLSTLGNCIRALADKNNRNKNAPISYRDSVLTKLLQHALGGNSKTVMIAALSPADINYDETLSTLRFADRAKSVKTVAKVNESSTEKLIRELKEENRQLMEKLKTGALPSSGQNYSNQEIEDMKKQLLEQMAANQRELEEMKQSWEERMKESQAELTEELEAERKKTEERKVIPHFWNLSEDSALTGMIIHFCREGIAKIGNKNATPAPEILMNGLSIQMEHACVTNKQGTVTLKPLSNAKILVNGKVIQEDQELHHNDRVQFGANHLYVFHHPQDHAKQIKLGNPVQQPTYDSAQEELAKESGLMDSNATKSKEDLILQEDLIQLLPMLREANAMSEELGKKVKFEICLVSPQARGLKEGLTEVMIEMKNLKNGSWWLLSRNNFINRKYLMQEMYQNYMEGDADWDVPKDKDPFWEPHTTPVLIGTAHIYLQSVAYLVDMDESMVIMDFKGKETGHLLTELIPCDNQWNAVKEDSFVDDPKQLVGCPLHFKFKIKGARGIPANFETTNCSYTFYLEDKPTTTKEIKGTINPDYEHERQISFKSATEQLIDYLDKDSVKVEVWGQQKEEGMRSKTQNSISTTKTLMLRERSATASATHVDNDGAEIKGNNSPSSAEATDKDVLSDVSSIDLFSQIQEDVQKAKELGLENVPIDTIEERLKMMKGKESSASSFNSSNQTKSSKVCILQ